MLRTTDPFGYQCRPAPFAFIEGTAGLTLNGVRAWDYVKFPFPFEFYGKTYPGAYVSVHGYVNFLEPSFTPSNDLIPSPSHPNAGIYAFWTNLTRGPGLRSPVFVTEVGTAPNRQYVIEWRAQRPDISQTTVRFEIVLSENGEITLQYHSAGPTSPHRGDAATIGIENETGTIGLRYSYNQPVLSSGSAISFKVGPSGFVEGTVVSATGEAISGATITASRDGRVVRTLQTDEAGHYRSRLPLGAHTLSIQAFGYAPKSVESVIITENATTALDFTLEPFPRFSLAGVVRDPDGAPVRDAQVSVTGSTFPPAVTAADGSYHFASVPAGEHAISINGGGCFAPFETSVTVDSSRVGDFTLTPYRDFHGYSCRPAPYAFIEASTILNMPDVAIDELSVELPFDFVFYGQAYRTLFVSRHGMVAFEPNASSLNRAIPFPFDVNNAIYAFWRALGIDENASVRTDVVGTAPNRQFVIEWRDLQIPNSFDKHVRFEVVLSESGEILMQYHTAEPDPVQRGASATVGIENALGDDGFLYSFAEPVLSSGKAIRFSPPPTGVLRGRVTDANDGQPIASGSITVRASDGTVSTTSTDANGGYFMYVRADDYVIEATIGGFGVETATVTVEDAATVEQNFALHSSRAELSPRTLQLSVPLGRTARRVLTLSNSGSLGLTFSVGESGGAQRPPTPASPAARLAPVSHGIPIAGDTAVARAAAPVGWNTRSLFGESTGAVARRSDTAPTVLGDVLRSLVPTDFRVVFGVGYSGNVWLSDIPMNTNLEFAVEGAPTGLSWSSPWANNPADMAYDSSRDLMCQINAGGDRGIHCWELESGSAIASITGIFPWTAASQLGLAYRADDDSFYVGGWDDGAIYHVAGLSAPTPGAVLGSCQPGDPNISGLAYNAVAGVLWVSTNSPTDTIYELNPEDCTVLATLNHLYPGFNGGGLELDENGNLWMISQQPTLAYLVATGVPADGDVPWLSVTPPSGTLAPGETKSIEVTIDTQGLGEGLYLATLAIRTNAPPRRALRVPVSLLVTSYQRSVDVGSTRPYTDSLGDVWLADQKHKNGGWGFVDKGSTDSTDHRISGTDDPILYRTLRSGPAAYRFDQVPNGIYEVDLRFAELANVRVGKRLFDVVVENTLVLPSHDVRYEVGRNAAENHVFLVPVTDNRLDVRFIARRGSEPPILNALRVTRRPDR